jgi:hypothetical protein
LRTNAEQLAGRVDSGIGSERPGELSVRVFGDAAIITGRNTITGVQRARTARIRFTDVFVRRDGRWQAVGAQEHGIERHRADIARLAPRVMRDCLSVASVSARGTLGTPRAGR